MERVAVILVREHNGRILELIACLNGIPADVLPVFLRALPIGIEWHRPGKEGQLHLATEVEVVDEISAAGPRQEDNGSAMIEVHPNFYHPIVEIAHLRSGRDLPRSLGGKRCGQRCQHQGRSNDGKSARVNKAKTHTGRDFTRQEFGTEGERTGPPDAGVQVGESAFAQALRRDKAKGRQVVSARASRSMARGRAAPRSVVYGVSNGASRSRPVQALSAMLDFQNGGAGDIATAPREPSGLRTRRPPN